MNNYDAIVIGSGIGGLTSASLLAQLKNKRVLVLERHGKLGGYTHTFKRQAKYKWDVGLHYVGNMEPGEQGRQVMDLVTGGQVQWAPQPEVYDVFQYPEFTVRVARSKAGFLESFLKVFPNEGPALERYLNACEATVNAMLPYLGDYLAPRWARPLVRNLPTRGMKWAKKTTAEVMAELVPNPQLRSALLSQWGDYGLPPAQSAFLIHAIVMRHYLQGGYYPVGGSNRIAEAVKTVVEGLGGEFRTKSEVAQILLDARGHARGVKLVDGTEIEAPLVISDAGARSTYLRLLPPEVAAKEKREIRTFAEGVSSITLFLGLKESPARLGLKGENYWLFDSLDHDDIYARRNALIEGKVAMAYVSFPSLKDPEATEHLAEIVIPTDLAPFAAWENQPAKRRDEDYGVLKDRIAQAVLAFTEARLPGFSALVEYAELATPLSNLHYCAHPGGAIYGVPCTPARFASRWARPPTPVPGVFLTGADAMAHGILGAMMGGVVGIGAIEGFRTLGQVFSRAKALGSAPPPPGPRARASTDTPTASPV